MTRSTVNRTLLGLIGLVLLAGGALLVVGGQGWGIGLPSSWTVTHPDHVLLTPAERTRWRAEGWWWPSIFAALGVAVVLTLWWLIAQLRRGAAAEVAVPGVSDLRVRLRGDALARAMSDEAERIPGVAGARVRLLGKRRRPHARVALLLEPGTAPGTVLRALSDGPLAGARSATGLDALPAEARLKVDPGQVGRVN